jgi:hypothetical protein
MAAAIDGGRRPEAALHFDCDARDVAIAEQIWMLG